MVILANILPTAPRHPLNLPEEFQQECIFNYARNVPFEYTSNFKAIILMNTDTTELSLGYEYV